MTKLTLKDVMVYESVTIGKFLKWWYKMFPKTFETRCQIKLGRYLSYYQEHKQFEVSIDWY